MRQSRPRAVSQPVKPPCPRMRTLGGRSHTDANPDCLEMLLRESNMPFGRARLPLTSLLCACFPSTRTSLGWAAAVLSGSKYQRIWIWKLPLRHSRCSEWCALWHHVLSRSLITHCPAQEDLVTLLGLDSLGDTQQSQRSMPGGPYPRGQPLHPSFAALLPLSPSSVSWPLT